MDPVQCKANYSRVCQLLVDKGGDALRAALHVVHPPSTIAAVLNANKSVLKKIRYSVINLSQWNLLYPASSTPDSRNFDVTLLTILLRNICGLPSPPAGWNVMPPAGDTSISANIARIKIFRNDVYGHTSSAQLDDTTFETLWQEISKPLSKLGIPQQDIDELKEAPLSSEEESYIEKLKEWKELEDDLLSKMNDLQIGVRNVENQILNVGNQVLNVESQVVNVENQVLNVENQVLELRRIVENPVPSKVDQLAKIDFTGKIDALCKKFQDGTRQWFFEKLSSWFRNEESRVMILTAGPGVGKSVLSAKVCDAYKQSGRLAAYHFCDFRNSDSRNPNIILQSLASQMCDSVEGFREKLTEALRREHSRDSLSDAFRVLLKDPLHAFHRHEPMLIVVDALDESKTDDKSEFLELISDEFAELPKWIKIFISSRPELQVRKKLQRLNPLEILPDDYYHNLDLNHFILHCLPNHYYHNLDLNNFILHCFPNLNQGNVSSLVSKCEGSFLYAYYLVNELKEMDLGIEPNLNDYVPKGISGFYEKQFKRLKTGLQRFRPDTWSSILKCFLNVVAASREPLPIKILFTCMGLSGAEYEIRETIIGIMSEILPLYGDCLTVYHKSLWDWLTLNGYDEHGFVANVADGTKRLWQACKSIYSDIASLRSISDFQISTEKTYALKSGGTFLLDVGYKEDFYWLVNVRLNFLKLKFHGNLGVDISRIIRFCKTTLSDHHYWGNIHLHAFSKIIENYRMQRLFYAYVNCREIYYCYLQSLANGYFDYVQNTINCKNEARDILDATNEIWMEEIGNQYNPNFKIINHAVMRDVKEVIQLHGFVTLSPDNKLLAYRYERSVEVFKLPSLRTVFDLEISKLRNSLFGIFSPDSSYVLWNSVRTCVSIREQKEIPFISHGPEDIYCCSFSSCGMKLVTSEKNFIKVWDVNKKNILIQIETAVDVHVEYCSLGNCNSYILAWPLTLEIMKAFDFNDIAFLESTTLKRVDTDKISCVEPCLTNEDSYQLISPGSGQLLGSIASFRIRHYHLPTGRIVLVSNKYCSKPFTWKDRRCVIFLYSWFLLVVYDFINQKVVDLFDMRCLPSKSSVQCISNLDERNFLICLNNDQVFVLSFEPSSESFVAAVANFGKLKCCALSPDNFYFVCCYEKGILTVRSVDNGQTLQATQLQKPPGACWWSELYLWVVCEGVVLKYPYDSTRNKVLGDYLEECAIDFKSVLKFAEGVLVIQVDDNGEIAILKTCDNKLCRQQIPDSSFTATSVAISSDGCAVLLYRKSSSDYQLWEIACENKWEICSTGKIDDSVAWFCLTGTKNFRSSLWLTFIFTCDEELREPLDISSVDFPNGRQKICHELRVPHSDSKVIYGDFNVVIIHSRMWVYFVSVSNGKTIISLHFGEAPCFWNACDFYIASRGMLLLAGLTDIKVFKIHNVENC